MKKSKRLLLIAVQIMAVKQAVASPSYKTDEVSPLLAVNNLKADDARLIEPTSVVLGKVLIERIKNDPRHPSEIIAEIRQSFPEYKKHLLLSALAYVRTLKPGLDAYCSDTKSMNTSVAPEGGLDIIEHAAIPLSTLKPLHADYRDRIQEVMMKLDLEPDAIHKLARDEAQTYQLKKYDCQSVKQLEKMEKKARKFSPKRWDRLVDLNHEISSAEAPYPRLQFSINGFTQYVYSQLFKLGHLSETLKITYDTQAAWVKDDQHEKPFIKTVTDGLHSKGYQRRDALLVMAYSTRNMPSIDVHYAYDPDKALELEVYFWKFHTIRNQVEQLNLKDVFPFGNFKRNPGVYHYLTAALMGCDVRLAGYAGPMARWMAFLSKAGYKTHKLINDLDKAKLKKEGLKYVKATARAQGYGAGLLAGWAGGKYGLRSCRMDLRERKTMKHELELELAVEELTGAFEEEHG